VDDIIERRRKRKEEHHQQQKQQQLDTDMLHGIHIFGSSNGEWLVCRMRVYQ
jgi:hypothetical protein